MNLYHRIKVNTALALLSILSILIKCSSATANATSLTERPSPSHLSWTSNNTRFDFVFNIEDPINDLVKLESDANNFLTSTLPRCTNHTACLFENGTFLESFHVNNDIPHESIFISNPSKQSNQSNQTSPKTQCDTNKFRIVHYCSTHWNAPIYRSRYGCVHIIELHSPLRCHLDEVNHEHPCFTYDPTGKLIDLTPWILSNGSSYKIDVDAANNSNIKEFHLNICNEAHDSCGPNISSCLIDKKHGLIETGYNNLTSIKYDIRDKVVLVTSLGHYRPQCEGDRTKTVIKFLCRDKATPKTGPKLLRSTACENIIEWPSMRACPVSEVRTQATNCVMKHEPLGINIDVKKLTHNRTVIEVPNIELDGKQKKMILGICQGIPRSIRCEGKQIANTKACLIDANDNSTIRSANNSLIVGSVTNSFITIADDRIYMESFALNKTCSEAVVKGFNVTQQVGTRIEFFCSNEANDLPTFLGYDDCTYVFEWGSPLMCLENFPMLSKKTEKIDDIKRVIPGDQIQAAENKTHTKDVKPGNVSRVEYNEHISTKPSDKSNAEKLNNSVPKMDSLHKYFMIGLIIMSFVAFIVIIFVLDKKTRLRVTLRQARQAFQTNQQPYSRVVNDLDL